MHVGHGLGWARARANDGHDSTRPCYHGLGQGQGWVSLPHDGQEGGTQQIGGPTAKLGLDFFVQWGVVHIEEGTTLEWA